MDKESTPRCMVFQGAAVPDADLRVLLREVGEVSAVLLRLGEGSGANLAVNQKRLALHLLTLSKELYMGTPLRQKHLNDPRHAGGPGKNHKGVASLLGWILRV